MALFNAIVQKNTTKALKIIESGHYDPNYIDKHGYTPLIWACIYKLSDVALALIETGQSNHEHANKLGYTALTYAKLHKLSDVIDALENYDNYMASLQQSTQSNPYDDPNYVMTIDI